MHSFDINTRRIGFACKWIDDASQIPGIKPRDPARLLNTSTTTVAWLNRQNRDVAEQKLWDLMVWNIESIRLLVERIGGLHENLRMVRLGSDILPVFTEPTWSYFYQRSDVREYCANHFARVGDIARRHNVRLSFHPGQFCVLASSDPGIVERSIEEFEYHAQMAAWMGYGRSFQDFKINIHISGRQGPAGLRAAWKRLSPEAKNCITVENEEMTHGLDLCLDVSDIVPVVLDIHHHWVREGEYILPTDVRVQRVIDSWRGIRPAMHYSLTCEEYVTDHAQDVRPCRNTLMEAGINKQKLRTHSDWYWNRASNDWALSFWPQFDIMCESKAKNLASFALYEHAKSIV